MNTKKFFTTLFILLGLIIISFSTYFYIENNQREEGVSARQESENIKLNNNELIFENEEYSFMYSSSNSCIKVDDKYLDATGKEDVWLCPGANISATISGSPDDVIDHLVFPGPWTDDIAGKACFYDEKEITPNGYTVRYFENEDPGVLRSYGNCGTHPTQTSAESVGNMNIYFVINSEKDEYVLINDINNTMDTTEVWSIINSLKFK